MEEKKKNYLWLIAILVIALIAILVFFVYGKLIKGKEETENNIGNTIIKDNVNPEQLNNTEVELYTALGGSGLEYEVGGVYVKIDNSGATLTYKSPSSSNIDVSDEIYEKYKELKKSIDIDKKSFSELIALINEKFYNLESDLSDDSVLDGGFTNITVKNKGDDTTYSVGGYAVRNEIFSEIESKIYETIGGYKIIKDFRKNEMTQFILDRENEKGTAFDPLFNQN